MIHAAYLSELDARLGAALGELLDGVYLIGSAVFGDYVEGESDLDVTAVCQDPPPPSALSPADSDSR